MQCHYPDQKTTGADATESPDGTSKQRPPSATNISEAFTKSVMPVQSAVRQQVPPVIVQFSHIPSMELAMIGDVVSRVDAMHETDTLSIYWGTKLLPE